MKSRRQHTFGLRFESLETRRVLTAWTNTNQPADVNDSGEVSAQDALLCLNELIRADIGIQQYTNSNLELPADKPEDAPFLDVDDNGVVSATDVIRVVNNIPRDNPPNTDPNPNDNIFFVEENISANALVGRINPSTNVTSSTRFEFTKDEALPEDISEVLELNPDDHYKGSPDAAVVIIEYVDFACPVCGLAHPLGNQSLQDFDGDVAIVTRHLPLSNVHPNAVAAAIAAEAAARQGMFDEMSDLLFEERTLTNWDDADTPNTIFRSFATRLGLNLPQFNADLEDPALESRVTRDRNEAINVLGLGGTPSFIFNDQLANVSPTQQSLNDRIQLSLDNVDLPFKVDHFTGDIRLREGFQLDFDTQSSYTFNVDVNGTVEEIEIRLWNPDN